ncbi:hypothetical protein FOZ62_002899, partial [Perkinsus olseni]
MGRRGGALEAISVAVLTDHGDTGFQYHGDVLVNEELHRRFKSDDSLLSIPDRETGGEVPSLKGHLLARLADAEGLRNFEDWSLDWWFSRHGHNRVGWPTRIDLEMTGLAEGFKISRLLTSLRNYVPKKQLKFDIGRLRELEERARRFLPDPARNWTDDYLLDICDKQLRSYLSYVQEKERLPYPDPFAKGYAAMFTTIFMWLV